MQSQNQNSPLLVVVNATGQQSTSVIHAASAAGFRVRAHVRSASKPEAKALEALPNVTLAVGSVDDDASFVNTLFNDADYAWVNTTFFQKETEVGKALALAAKNAGVKHYVYSSLPDHSRISNGKWKCDLWAQKYAVEEYIRTLDSFPATFVYVGGYLQGCNKSIPLMSIERQEDGSIVISGCIKPDAKMEYLDIDDLGPAIVNILKQGPAKWNHKRVPLAFDVATKEQLAKRFSDATGVKVIYNYVPKEIDPTNPFDNVLGIIHDGIYFDFDCKVPDEARELNPNWHSLEDFAKNKWKKPEA